MKSSRERQRMRQYLSIQKKGKEQEDQISSKPVDSEGSQPNSQAPKVPVLDVFELSFSRLSLMNSDRPEVEVTDSLSLEKRLPVELWREIFRLATAMAGRDEFSLQSSTYHSMICDKKNTIIDYSFEEQSLVIKTRLTIVQVCRYWYAVGMEHFWSHIQLIIPTIPSRKSISSLLSTIQDTPLIASFFIRLSIVILPKKSPEWLYTDVADMIKHLVNLKIFSSPFHFDTHSSLLQLHTGDIISYKPSGLHLSRAHSFRDVRAMEVHFHKASPTIAPKLVLPALESLKISSYEAPPYLNHILAKNWSLPSLQTLSISSDVVNLWMDCLQAWGKRLRIVQLMSNGLLHGTVDGIAYTPELSTLHLSTYTPHTFSRSIIRAPNLMRFGLIDSAGTTGPCGAVITRILDAYPSVQELCLITLSAKGPIEAFGIIASELDIWRRRGIEIEIRSN